MTRTRPAGLGRLFQVVLLVDDYVPLLGDIAPVEALTVGPFRDQATAHAVAVGALGRGTEDLLDSPPPSAVVRIEGPGGVVVAFAVAAVDPDAGRAHTWWGELRSQFRPAHRAAL